MNTELDIAKQIPIKKLYKSCQRNKILKSFYYYPTNFEEIFKIIKIFSNSESLDANRLPTSTTKNYADLLSVP